MSGSESSGLQLTHEQRGDILVATLLGEFDRSTCEGVEQRLLDALEPGARRLACDLSGVDFIDSAGLHTLHKLSRSLSAGGRSMSVVMPRSPTARRVLEVTGIAASIALFETAAQALEA